MARYKDIKAKLLADPKKRAKLSRLMAISKTGGMVYQWRKSNGLSQTQLAEAIGSTQESISRIEKGNVVEGPKLATLAAIANACGKQLTLGTIDLEIETVDTGADWNVESAEDVSVAHPNVRRDQRKLADNNLPLQPQVSKD